MERPTEEHMKAVKRILRYVNGTLDYGLRYKKSTETTQLAGYSDSDHAAISTATRAPAAPSSTLESAW
jgi:hypothetical protein